MSQNCLAAERNETGWVSKPRTAVHQPIVQPRLQPRRRQSNRFDRRIVSERRNLGIHNAYLIESETPAQKSLNLNYIKYSFIVNASVVRVRGSCQIQMWLPERLVLRLGSPECFVED